MYFIIPIFRSFHRHHHPDRLVVSSTHYISLEAISMHKIFYIKYPKRIREEKKKEMHGARIVFFIDKVSPQQMSNTVAVLVF